MSWESYHSWVTVSGTQRIIHTAFRPFAFGYRRKGARVYWSFVSKYPA